MHRSYHSFNGCLLGGAVGDALALPREGVGANRQRKLYTQPDRHALLPGWGMVSDDTEHAVFTAQAVLASKGDAREFQRRLARALRWWLLGLPAGVGFATLRSIIKLWLGFSPERSGVFSAGNGPAMRSPLLGAVFGDDLDTLKEYVRRSTRITHSDPKAYYGALAVALAAWMMSAELEANGTNFLHRLKAMLPKENSRECLELMEQAISSAASDESVRTFAERMGSKNGVSGYIYHTAPCVIQVWLRHPDDYRAAILEMMSAGGDTDTTCAILGGIIGAGVGEEGIPQEWLAGMIEWPRSVNWMRRLAGRLSDHCAGIKDAKPLPVFIPAILPRNLFFLTIVLLHGLRRLLPPY